MMNKNHIICVMNGIDIIQSRQVILHANNRAATVPSLDVDFVIIYSFSYCVEFLSLCVGNIFEIPLFFLTRNVFGDFL